MQSLRSTPQTQVFVPPKASPKSFYHKSFSNKQNFSATRQFPQTMPGRQPLINLAAQNLPSTSAAQLSTPPSQVLKAFNLNQEYPKPKLAILFGADARQSKHLLQDDLFINFDGRTPIDDVKGSQYKLLGQHISNGTITLQLYSIWNLIRAKMFNPNYPSGHLKKCVTGCRIPNFANYMIPGEFIRIVGQDMPVLQGNMEIIINFCTSQFAGLIIDMLINDQSVDISKRKFGLHSYFEDEKILTLSTDLLHVNNRFYPIEYQREIQFFNEETGEIHTLTICAAFCIFRIKNAKGQLETLINLLSVYPLGNEQNYQHELWRDDMNLRWGDPKEEIKFNQAKKTFENTSIHRGLHKLYPDLENDKKLQAEFIKICKLNPLNKKNHSLDINGYNSDIIWVS